MCNIIFRRGTRKIMTKTIAYHMSGQRCLVVCCVSAVCKTNASSLVFVCVCELTLCTV